MKKRLKSIFGSNQYLHAIDENSTHKPESESEIPAISSKSIPIHHSLVKSQSDLLPIKNEPSSQHAVIKRRYKSVTSPDGSTFSVDASGSPDVPFIEGSFEDKNRSPPKPTPSSSLSRNRSVSITSRPWLTSSKRASLARREANNFISNVHTAVDFLLC